MIRGYFGPDRDWPVPYVKVGVLLVGRTTTWRSVDFLLDTGAASTSIQPRDAMQRWNFTAEQLQSQRHWPPARRIQGIGGGVLHFPVPCRYAFEDTEDGTLTIDDEILIAQFRPDNQNLPSVMGWNLLKRFGMRIDLRDRAVWLDMH